MKGIYITYGIFRESLGHFILDLASELRISLEEDKDEQEPYLLFEMIEKHHPIIKCFEVTTADPAGYHLEGGEILYPHYLVRCNLIFDENTPNIDSEIDKIRKIIEQKTGIKPLNIIETKWDD